jgi:phosphopantothenate---cysteine ligase (ATP)
MQSSGAPPVISLQLVPKILSPLVKDWVPEGFVVSFKLETDDSLLVPKSQAALKNYGHKVEYSTVRQNMLYANLFSGRCCE